MSVLPARFARRLMSRRATLAAGIVASLAVAPVACAQVGASGNPTAAAPTVAQAPLAQMPSFAPLVRKVLPAVVNVSVVLSPAAALEDEEDDDTPPGERLAPLPSPWDELLRRFFEQQLPQRSNPKVTTLGSGFIIDPAGYVVTSNHVVTKADKISVIFQDDTRHPAKIVGRDAMTDLAVLKIDVDHPLPYLAWGDSDAAQVGDWVLAVGNPFGLGGTVSSGIISARGRDIHSGPYDDFLQIDASINRGNSGGPAFNLAGEVIGIATAIYSPSGGSVGIAFAIPSNLARPVIEQLRAHGRMSRGWIGVQIQEVTPELAASLGLSKAEGALVADVIEGGPAAKSGFRPGDVILSFDGHPIQRLRDLSVRVADTPIGRTATVTLWRKDRELTLSPVIEEMPEAHATTVKPRAVERNRRPERTSSIMGLTLGPLTPEWRRRLHIPDKTTGVLVMALATTSPFAGADISPGDVIVTIDQQPVSTPQDAATKLADAAKRKDGSVLILLNRGGAGRFVSLPIDHSTGGSGGKKRH